MDGQYERAIECALRSVRENRTYTAAHRLLVIALVLVGRENEALIGEEGCGWTGGAAGLAAVALVGRTARSKTKGLL